MYLTERTVFNNRPAWVSSHHYINRTRTATQDMATEEEGRLILRAGSVFYGADGTAEGLVFHDVDLTNAETMPVAVMVEGYVYASRLPETVEAADMDAMTEIKFEEYNETEEDGTTGDGGGEA